MKSVKGREDLLKTIVMLVGENDYDLKDTSEFPHWFIKFQILENLMSRS